MRMLDQKWKLSDKSENDELWYLPLASGYKLCYDKDTEEFGFKNYWNFIEEEEAEWLIENHGVGE